jgi:hypothetical protein
VKCRGYARRGQAAACYKLLCSHIHPLTMQARYTIKHLQIRSSFRLVTSDKIRVNVHIGQLMTVTGLCRQRHGDGSRIPSNVSCEMCKHNLDLNKKRNVRTGMRSITTFRSTTDRIYDGGIIRLYYYNIILTIVLQLPTLFSTVTCSTV